MITVNALNWHKVGKEKIPQSLLVWMSKFCTETNCWATNLDNPSVPLGTGPVSGREIADAGKEGTVFLAGVPTGVEVAIGWPADCSTWWAVPDRRGLLRLPRLLPSPLDRCTSDSLSRKLTNSSENDWKSKEKNLWWYEITVTVSCTNSLSSLHSGSS